MSNDQVIKITPVYKTYFCHVQDVILWKIRIHIINVTGVLQPYEQVLFMLVLSLLICKKSEDLSAL